jgi:lysophospholipase L1-like esterase
MRKIIFISIFSVLLSYFGMAQTLNLLSLGDSYTIGESVQEAERFPVQTLALLHAKGIAFSAPTIVAKTGWTTDELQAGIKDAHITGTYNAVTLLIGVNNQYRGLSRETYRKEFVALLQQAIQYAGGNAAHVFVLSIPDWGVTPFAHGKNKDQVAEDIDAFNAIGKEEAEKLQCHFLNITPSSRLAETDRTLSASDGLHPSAKMYAMWSAALADAMEKEFKH